MPDSLYRYFKRVSPVHMNVIFIGQVAEFAVESKHEFMYDTVFKE